MGTEIIINSGRGVMAREKLKALGSPRDIQRQNLLRVLLWLYRWGYSTSAIISDLLERANRGHAHRLERAGWIRSVTVAGYPTYFVLTERGLAEAIQHFADLLEYREIDPYRVHLPTLHHNLVAQRETVRALRHGGFTDFKTERMYNLAGDNAPLKVPDVILVEQVESDLDEGWVAQYTAFEIELTPKWNHHLDQFITNIVTDIQEGRFRRCVIISDSTAILARYESTFQPGRKVSRWEKQAGGKMVNARDDMILPPWIPKHVFFRTVGESYPFL